MILVEHLLRAAQALGVIPTLSVSPIFLGHLLQAGLVLTAIIVTVVIVRDFINGEYSDED